MAVNDLDYLRRVLQLLGSHGIAAWVFGGWGEQLRGLVAPRPHHDIDLLYPAPDFATVDEFLASGVVDEIVAKRFPHKRAFELGGVMTELFLVRNDPAGHYTDFWGDQRYDWPNDVFGHVNDMPVTSAATLAGFRTKSHGFTPTLDGVPVSLEEWTRHHLGDELGS